MLDLHYWPTPNGKKVTIQLEECGLDYNLVECNIGKGTQFTGEFLSINPNNRMPALVDNAPEDGGGPISVFESGAIMLYIAEKSGQFMPSDPRGKFNVVQRFTDEVNRFYGVLNNQLYQQRYICGDEYTIADMICYPWTVNWAGQGQDINDFKYFRRWFDELSDRPAVQRGMAAGSDMQNDFSSLSKEEAKALRALLYNQRARPAPETGGIES